MDILQTAAIELLERETRKGRKKLMLGIFLVSIGMDFKLTNTGTSAMLALQPRVARNPGYQGELKLQP